MVVQLPQRELLRATAELKEQNLANRSSWRQQGRNALNSHHANFQNAVRQFEQAARDNTEIVLAQATAHTQATADHQVSIQHMQRASQ